jgi:8-oxo-dGTP pyrophosphatase MutT (NUDIX family)
MSRAWKRLSSQVQNDRHAFRILSERFLSGRNGAQIEATIVESPNWVNVLPVTPDGDVVLIRQYRFGCMSETLEIPGGLIDPGEEPIVAAGRELREETGFRAGTLTSLGSVQPNPAFMRNRLYCFLAEGCVLEGAQEQDSGEDIAVELHPLSTIDALIARGGMDHALAQLAFQRLAMLRAGIAF